IVQPENTFDDFRKISRDPQVPSPPAVLAARMPVEAEFDFKSTTECTHWPGKDDRAPRNAFTFYSQAFRLREGPDTREVLGEGAVRLRKFLTRDRKSTRLNSSHLVISYAVFCLKKKKTKMIK